MKIERQSEKRRFTLPMVGCGCLALVLVGALSVAIMGVIFAPLVPNVALQLAGFEDVGTSDTLFADAPRTPPTPLANPQPLSETLALAAAGYGQRTLDTRNPHYSVSLSGRQMQIRFTDTSLNALCRQQTDFCAADGQQLRNAVIDTRNGGALITGAVYVPQVGIYQQAGVALQTVGNRVAVIGVEVNGRVYAVPDNELGNTVLELERALNDLLQNATLTANGTAYRLLDIHSDDEQVITTWGR
jgi:hypothetical protein